MSFASFFRVDVVDLLQRAVLSFIVCFFAGFYVNISKGKVLIHQSSYHILFVRS